MAMRDAEHDSAGGDVSRALDHVQLRLFELPPGEAMSGPADEPLESSAAAPRSKRADREQVEFRACCWNDLLPGESQ